MPRLRSVVAAALVAAVLGAAFAPCPPPDTAPSAGAATLVPLCWCHLGDAPATVTIAGSWSAIPSAPLPPLPGLPGSLAPPAPPGLPSPPPDLLAPVPISV